MEDLPDVPAPDVADPVGEAKLQDLATVAEQEGISLESAIDKYTWQDNFSLLVDNMRGRFPDRFSGAEIEGSRKAWIGFTGSSSRFMREDLDAFRSAYPDVAVDVGLNRGFTERQLDAAIEAAHHSVRRASNASPITTTADSKSGLITTTIPQASLPPDLTSSHLENVGSQAVDLRSTVGPGAIELGVRLSKSRVLHEPEAHIGGEPLSTCTSGFTVIRNGVTGVSTAAHCRNAQSDDGRGLTFKGAHEGNLGDFQWNSGPESEPDDFFSGNAGSTQANRRDVSGVGGVGNGDRLCFNGKSTHKHCQTVRKRNVCAGNLCNLVQMGSHQTAGGDSGGPWFYGNTAHGIHMGKMYDPFWPYDRSIFSKATLIDNALGVTIRR